MTFAVTGTQEEEEMSEWLPIESAPIGEDVLIGWPVRPDLPGSGGVELAMLSEAGEWFDEQGAVWVNAPSHWMPLPDPPS